MTPAVMTVLGPVEAGALGVTLPHEHIRCDLRYGLTVDRLAATVRALA